MIKNWKMVVFIASVAINLAVIVTFGLLWAADKDNPKKPPYTEKELEEFNKTVWKIKITLDTIEVKPLAIQFASFDYDPLPNFRNRVIGYSKIYKKMMKETDNEIRIKLTREAAIRRNWDKEFENITGDKVNMIVRNSVITLASDGPSGKIWIVTKYSRQSNGSLCWCIPVEPEIGKEVTVDLTKTTVFKVEKEFDLAIAEGNKK